MRSTGRAVPMPPELRRAAIVDAAIPLLRRHGVDVTTKQIADAAGIAEGTIFRVFGDKEALIGAVVKQVFDSQPTIDELGRIDAAQPLRERLRCAVEIICAQLDHVWELMSALQMMGAPEQNPRFRSALPPGQQGELVTNALIPIIEPDQRQLRVDSAHAARMLRLVTFACSHPRVTDGNPLKPDEIVELLLDGLQAHAP